MNTNLGTIGNACPLCSAVIGKVTQQTRRGKRWVQTGKFEMGAVGEDASDGEVDVAGAGHEDDEGSILPETAEDRAFLANDECPKDTETAMRELKQITRMLSQGMIKQKGILG